MEIIVEWHIKEVRESVVYIIYIMYVSRCPLSFLPCVLQNIAVDKYRQTESSYHSTEHDCFCYHQMQLLCYTHAQLFPTAKIQKNRARRC